MLNTYMYFVKSRAIHSYENTYMHERGLELPKKDGTRVHLQQYLAVLHF